ncbi:MAG TPA: DoxX family protein [Bryobacteraceae bacterium]
MNSFVRLGFFPPGYNFGLLVLRVCFGFGLFWCHGLSKISNFAQMSQHFADPLHIGVRTTLMLAIFAESVCAFLVVLGLATRWAAIVIAIDVGVAFSLVHKFRLTGQGNGEVALLYLTVMVVLFICGAGRYSLDGKA